MGLFKKKMDPISDRARTLSAEIAALEAQIKKLNTQTIEPPPAPHPRVRSTVRPEATPAPAPPVLSPDPVFEVVDRTRIETPVETVSTPAHYNDLGMRKYDLPALLRRLQHHFRGPTATNPKLIDYLAAGSIQGLRPLRYEKRVARNRVIALTAVLFVVLWAIFAFLIRLR